MSPGATFRKCWEIKPNRTVGTEADWFWYTWRYKQHEENCSCHNINRNTYIHIYSHGHKGFISLPAGHFVYMVSKMDHLINWHHFQICFYCLLVLGDYKPELKYQLLTSPSIIETTWAAPGHIFHKLSHMICHYLRFTQQW